MHTVQELGMILLLFVVTVLMFSSLEFAFEREGEVEAAVARQRRQVEVLDHAYGARLPDSDSELSVYSKWFSSDLAPHHKLSAAWPGGEEAGHGGEEYQEAQPRAHR